MTKSFASREWLPVAACDKSKKILIGEMAEENPRSDADNPFGEQAELFGGPSLTLPSQNSTPYGGLVNNFKFLEIIML